MAFQGEEKNQEEGKELKERGKKWGAGGFKSQYTKRILTNAVYF